MTSDKGGFIVDVEVKFIDDIVGYGVFSKVFIPQGTLLWTPGLVIKYSPSEVERKMLEMDRSHAQRWLRHSFVLKDEPQFLCVNENDDGRFVNHSSTPTSCYASVTEPSIAFRDIEIGEEITVDYSGLGDPQWYQELCKKFEVLTTSEVVRLYSGSR